MSQPKFSVVAVFIGMALQLSSTALAGQPHALVIGVKYYDPDQLTTVMAAEKEALTLADLLKRGGYEEDRVTILSPSEGANDPTKLPTRVNIMEALDELSTQLDRDDTLVITFSGHGLQGSNGRYYLCPFDADLEDTGTLISAQEVYATLKSCRSTQKLILIDAMHQAPFSDQLEPSVERQFKALLPELPPPPRGTAVWVSCAPGQSVSANRQSKTTLGPFFGAIAKSIEGEAAGQDGSVTLPDVERYLKQRFHGAQERPVLSSNLTGLLTIVSHSLGESDHERIQMLIRGDFYEQAQAIVDEILAKRPNDGNALAQHARLIGYRAEQFRDYSKMDEALTVANKAVQVAPNEALPYVARANVYRILKQYEKSFADATTSVQKDPGCVMAHVIRAFAFHHLHDLEAMGREAKLGMEIDPEYPEPRATYVAYLFAKGQFDEANRELDRTIAISPDMPALYFLKGYGYEKVGKHNEAIQQFSKAIALNDQIPGYLCRRALSLANGGRFKEALADVARAESVMPTYVDIASSRAMIVQKQRGYGHSESSIAEGLKANPDSADLWQGRGFNHYSRQRYTDSIAAFKKALEINPGYGEAHMGIGMVYIRQNRLDDALVHLNRATRHKPHLARAYFEKAEVYRMKRDYRAAVKELDQAIRFDPSNQAFRQQRQRLGRQAGT